MKAHNKTCFCTATTGFTCKMLFFPVCVKQALSIDKTQLCFFSLFLQLSVLTSVKQGHSVLQAYEFSFKGQMCITLNSAFLKDCLYHLYAFSANFYLFDNHWIIRREHHATINQGLWWVTYNKNSFFSLRNWFKYFHVSWQKKKRSVMLSCNITSLFVTLFNNWSLVFGNCWGKINK